MALSAAMAGAANPQRTTLWSLQPVRNPALPKTKFDALAQNAIDRFVFAKLQEKGLRPSSPADRLALIRRVTIDLTGLPPTPEEVAAFLNDTSSQAYENIVDRLLAAPAYGERWARHWLDVVRYGESNGYEQNHLRPNAWPYRDYVIRAFNEDKPYTQFIAEQLAGDVVGRGNANLEAATGFLVAGVHDTVGNQTEEGTRQQRSNDLDDIVSTVGATFLGLTVGCAKCHDHKFDPIPQRDYYRFSAVFAGVRHGERAAAEAGETIPNRFVDKFAPVTARFVRFTVYATNDGTEPCLDELEIYGPSVGGESLPRSSGETQSGKGFPSYNTATNLALSSNGAKATASSLLPNYPIHQIHHLNDGQLGNDFSWISNERGKGWAQIELSEPATVNRIVWSRDGASAPRYRDRIPTVYRVEVSDDGNKWQTVVNKGQRPEGAPTKAYIGQFTTPDVVHLLKRGDVMQRGEEVAPAALSQIPGFIGELTIPPTRALPHKEGGSHIITTPSLLVGEGPGGGKFSEEQHRRLALARWLRDEKNPLTARVIVNRLWQHHFGRGLVGTPSDFGANGEQPTHPELLDWLARDLARPDGREAHGWTLKRMHKMMVMSYAYRQDSRERPPWRSIPNATAPVTKQGNATAGVPEKVDAGNQLLWRMPLRRMEAEVIRDSILAVSGKLNREMGGPSFKLFKYRIVNVAIYEPLEEHGPETWRRGIYSQPARAIREDLLASFDCPECAQRAPRREVTTTALQALSLLNGSFIVQQSEFFAERVRREAGDATGSQIERAFRLAFGRAPSASERNAAFELLAKAGLATLCRGLLNANEFLFY